MATSLERRSVRFLDEHLKSIVRIRVILDAFRADPQKVGKNEGSYDLVLDAFETEVLKRQAVAASALGARSMNEERKVAISSLSTTVFRAGPRFGISKSGRK